MHVSIASGTGSALIALSPTGVGAAAQDLMIPQNNTQSPTFYIQGTGAGSATITATASGYAQVMATETIDDTGFIFTSGLPITTTTISQPTNLTIEPALITPGTLAVVYSGYGVGCGNVGCVLVNAAAINLNKQRTFRRYGDRSGELRGRVLLRNGYFYTAQHRRGGIGHPQRSRFRRNLPDSRKPPPPTAQHTSRVWRR